MVNNYTKLNDMVITDMWRPFTTPSIPGLLQFYIWYMIVLDHQSQTCVFSEVFFMAKIGYSPGIVLAWWGSFIELFILTGRSLMNHLCFPCCRSCCAKTKKSSADDSSIPLDAYRLMNEEGSISTTSVSTDDLQVPLSRMLDNIYINGRKPEFHSSVTVDRNREPKTTFQSRNRTVST